MKQRFIFCIIAFALTACNYRQQSKIVKHDKENIYSVEGDDIEMNKAIADARATFQDFEKAFTSNEFDTSKFLIKVKFVTQNRGHEHMWITSLKKQGKDYYGVLDEEPESTKMVKLGELIKVNKEDISDWLYAAHDTLRGGYTIRVIRRRLSKNEQIKFDKSFSLKIVD